MRAGRNHTETWNTALLVTSSSSLEHCLIALGSFIPLDETCPPDSLVLVGDMVDQCSGHYTHHVSHTCLCCSFVSLLYSPRIPWQIDTLCSLEWHEQTGHNSLTAMGVWGLSRKGWCWGGSSTQTWRRALLMHRELFPPHHQYPPRGRCCQLPACKVVHLPHCVRFPLPLWAVGLQVLVNSVVWNQRWGAHPVDFATLPIIQMFLNATCPVRSSLSLKARFCWV